MDFKPTIFQNNFFKITYNIIKNSFNENIEKKTFLYNKNKLIQWQNDYMVFII